MRRNGATISNGGPMWSRTFDRAHRKLILQQDGWSIVYDSDTGHDQAELFHGNNLAATGVCDADYSIDAPQPAPREAQNTPSYTAQAPSGPDAVGILSSPKGAIVQVALGSDQEMMLIDTGASNILVSPSVAAKLVNAGEAEWGESGVTEVADGSKVQVRTITIRQVRIGRHVLYDVPALVNAQDAMMLLGFPVLNQMSRFTIDTTSNLLIFG